MIRGWKTTAYLSVLLSQQVTGRWRDPAEIGLYSDQAVLAGELWLQRDPSYLQSCLDCGASPAGGGAVSSERLAEGREKPTSNISRASTKTERHDAQVEKEIWQNIWKMKLDWYQHVSFCGQVINESFYQTFYSLSHPPVLHLLVDFCLKLDCKHKDIGTVHISVIQQTELQLNCLTYCHRTL